MAKLITKFKYLKPNARTSVGGYAKYIATREGVDKIDQSFKLAPSSLKQQQLIEKILTDFPDSKEMLEYEDYLKEPTVGNASEFITRALEDNAYEVRQTKTYADYIATRPRAQRFGTHDWDSIKANAGGICSAPRPKLSPRASRYQWKISIGMLPSTTRAIILMSTSWCTVPSHKSPISHGRAL